MTDFYLFFDLETTGLSPADDTLLEAGWTVLGADLQQRSPLRSRFLSYAPMTRATRIPELSYDGKRVVWNGDVPTIVQDMHTSSGLAKEWAQAPEVSRVSTQLELDRLLIDSLVESGWTGAKDQKVYLTGAGVSHFDHQVLKAAGSRLITDNVLHYSAVDTSVALRTLGIEAPKNSQELSRMIDRLQLGEGSKAEEDLLRLVVERNLERLVRSGSGVEETMIVTSVKQHRAADDVAWSIVLMRLLRLLVGYAPSLSA